MSWVEISSEKWNAFETDEFLFESLVLWKRWSSLYTKCIQFLPYSSQILLTCDVGQMMIPCHVSTFSEFICSAFQLQGHLAQNKSLNAWEIANEVRKGWNFSMWLSMVHFGCKKILSWNKFRKMKCLWNRWVFVWNPRTLKEIVQFVQKVHVVLP